MSEPPIRRSPPRRALPFGLLLALLLALLLTACPAPSSSAGPTGSLEVTVAGLPSGLTADVTVIGPGGFGAAVTATTTLDELTPGSYTVSAATITSSAVTSEYDATITPASVQVVADRTATVAVEYERVGGTLAVAVSGLPPAVDADVTITGPAGFSRDLTASEVLTEVDPGVYSASASSVTNGSDSYTPSVSGSPAEVSSSTGAGITVAYALDPGSLQLTIAGLPGGLDASLNVAGPNGFSQAVPSSTTLTGLEPGIYTLTAASVVTDDPVVSEAYDLSAAPPASVEVTSSTTTSATTTYAKRGGTGRLWRALADDPLLAGYTSAQLAASGAPAPDVALTVTGGDLDEFVAFDGDGNAWVSNIVYQAISRYDAARLEVDATVTADVAIVSDGTSLDGAAGLAFDAAGNLWVAANTGNRLEMFTPAQLAAGGPLPPAIVLDTDGSSLTGPCDLAFDGSGTLWVSTFGVGTLEAFTPVQLAASGTPAPDVTIASDGTSLDFPCGLAFDSGGNLWVATVTSDRVEMFTPAQLAAGGTPAPAVVLGSDGSSLDGAFSLAFDNSGNLWVNSGVTQQIEKFTPDQLTASGTPTPSVVVGAGLADAAGLAFSPPPPELPIHTP